MLPREIEKYAIDLLLKLIPIQTVNPPGIEYEKCSNLLKTHLKHLGFQVELVSIPEDYLDKHYPYAPDHRGHPRLIVLGRIGAGHPILHFNGHYDVVPAGAGWTTDPFGPAERGGRLYGRGSSDMKGGIAAIVGSVKHVVTSGLKLGGTIEVAFVPDEESGGAGTKYLMESGKTKPDYVIIGEPTHPPIHGISIGHKGAVRGIVRVLGKQVHGSMPWLGENAFVNAANLVSEFMKEYRPFIDLKSTDLPVRPPDGRHPTINLGGYAESLSKKDNVVPGEFTFSFDRRVLPEEDINEAAIELQEFMKRAAELVGARYEVKIQVSVPGSVTRPDSKLVRIVGECIKSKLNAEPALTISFARDDAVFYHVAGVDQVINFGPGVIDSAHTSDEYIAITELNNAVEIYCDVIRAIVGKT